MPKSKTPAEAKAKKKDAAMEKSLTALKEAKSMLGTLLDECEHFNDEVAEPDWYLREDYEKAVKCIDSALRAISLVQKA